MVGSSFLVATTYLTPSSCNYLQLVAEIISLDRFQRSARVMLRVVSNFKRFPPRKKVRIASLPQM